MAVSSRHPPERDQAGAEDGPWLDRTARVGVVVYGIVHLIVAWLVLRLALGDGSGSASGSGALHTLARSGVGRASLLGVAVGFFALAVWQAVEALLGYRREGTIKRVLNRIASGAKVAVFAVIGVNALMLAAGDSAGGTGTDGVTARLMRLPSGPLIVGMVGIGIIAVALVFVYFGLAQEFRDVMSTDGETGRTGRSYIALGTTGYVCKGVAVALVGLLFVYAALTHDPQKSGGLDPALHRVLQEPFGAPVLVVIALGLACYGLFCFAWARHFDR